MDTVGIGENVVSVSHDDGIIVCAETTIISDHLEDIDRKKSGC